jgi:hypothetical protein
VWEVDGRGRGGRRVWSPVGRVDLIAFAVVVKQVCSCRGVTVKRWNCGGAWWNLVSMPVSASVPEPMSEASGWMSA